MLEIIPSEHFPVQKFTIETLAKDVQDETIKIPNDVVPSKLIKITDCRK